jgi:hypothetical protein
MSLGLIFAVYIERTNASYWSQISAAAHYGGGHKAPYGRVYDAIMSLGLIFAVSIERTQKVARALGPQGGSLCCF